MLSSFFSRKPRKTEPQSAASMTAGMRVYAIGDIHGRSDLLNEILARIAEDDARRVPTRTQLVFLGDYVDRGPDSAGVLDRLIRLEQERPETHFLMGNHDEVFASVLAGDVKALKFFHRIGGRETILSYGMAPDTYDRLDYPDLLERILALVPAAHVAFLRRLEDMVVLGDYTFVHAGIRPDVPLDRQKPADLHWIREEFLEHDTALGTVVVHGHTISEAVETRAHRIGIDTGAYQSGRLTALGLEGNRHWSVQTQAPAQE